MRPLDPRLLRYAVSARWLLAGGLAVGVATTVTIVTFAWLLTACITGAVAGDSLESLLPQVGALAVVGAVRAALLYAQDLLSAHGAARVKSELRVRVLAAVRRLGPAWLSTSSDGRVTTLLGRGMDALDDYFAKYLPQLLLTVVVTPVIVAIIFFQDLVSAIFILVTLPLIPVFMVLIGWATQSVQRRQWDVLGNLSTNFIDMLGGLATLKIFGRQHRQIERMRSITRDYRVETMRVLRVAFLSGFVLELAASLSVALVAVSVGLRLVDGSMDLSVGLFVLLLAPEAFLPLRQVGANFHAAAEGVAAAEDAFSILDEDRQAEFDEVAPVASRAPADGGGTLTLERVGVDYGSGPVLEPVSGSFTPGTVTVLTGPSGAGKSTLLAAMTGFARHEGSITLGGGLIDSRSTERPWLAWTGQRPSLVSGTVASNVSLGSGEPQPELIRRALDLAAAHDVSADAVVGPGGAGLSGGQAQRVAVARAIHRTLERGCQVLLLDEPSSALDHDTERRLLSGLRLLADDGVTVLIVSHRVAIISAADAVVPVVPIRQTVRS
ncbi:ATP-binding cassette subfamily C protein CydD [Mycetocola sp. CAN_C7]|uniref:thiol reductant ABC exporter subunit CydD n=1 Tax=Mycetocola sp. CAN_C7 TaxID=2787724 RepID=UPI0018C909BA